MSPQKPLILIIDDEEAILQTLKDALTDESYRVETLSQGQKALDRIGEIIPDLVLLDIFMPNCNGLKLLTKIKKEYPDQKIIIISGFGTIPIAIEAIQKGAIDFIEKPLNLDEILNKIDFLKKTKKQKESHSPVINKLLLQKCNIVGESNLFLELIQQVDRLAPHFFPILIYGEYGTGKTNLAHYIHHKSNLADKTFEIINCESIDEVTIKTIFTKTFSEETPKTVYLKQIDALDNKKQKKLLVNLEQATTIRTIASSSQSLFVLMQKKEFNSSLFAYLNKAPLEIPPLRKRPYDIPLLINHYVSHYNLKHKKRILFSTQTIRLLRNHKWPGNIHELKVVIENIVIRTQEDHAIITPEQVVSVLGEKDTQFIEEQSLFQFDSIEQATTEFKKNFLLYLLRTNRYNIDQVSHRLNLSPVQLKNQLLELKINVKFS